MATHYIVRTGEIQGHKWMQVERIRDERVDLVEYEPAELGGWNFKRHTVFSGDDWPRMTADQILAYKREVVYRDCGITLANQAQIESCNRFSDRTESEAA